jgi:Replication protein
VELLKREEPDIGDLVAGCGWWLHLREWLQSGETRLRNANFCGKFLLCRSCAARRAGKMVAAYAEKVAAVTASAPDLIPAMLTFTVKNGDDLAERLAHLKKSWSAMIAAARKGKSKSGRHEPIEWNKVRGSVRAIEVTNKGNGWHPHIHVFALLSAYIDQPTLSAEWQRFTGDSFVVGVTKCKGGIVPGLIETLKYCSKLTELEPSQVLHVWRTAKGSRFTDPQGILRGVPEPDIRQDDDEGLSGPYRDFFALWCRSKAGYDLRPVETAADPARLPQRPS